MDKLDRILTEHLENEIPPCPDNFAARVLAKRKPRVHRRLPIRGLAAACLCGVLALGAAAGGLRFFYPGRGFTAESGAYYISESTSLGECVVDSAIYSDGILSVYLHNDYHKVSAPSELELNIGDSTLTAEAHGINPNQGWGAGFSAYEFELDELPESGLTLSDGVNVTLLSLSETPPESSFYLPGNGYNVTISQLTADSRLLAAEIAVDEFDPIAREAKRVAFDLSDHSIFRNGKGFESRAYTDGDEYIIHGGRVGIAFVTEEGLADIEERREHGINISTGSDYMMLCLERIGLQGHPDEFELDSAIRSVKIERLGIVASSTAVGYPLEPEHWDETAFDTSRIVVPAVDSGLVELAEPVVLEVGAGLRLELTSVERCTDERYGDRLYIDFTYETAEEGIVIEDFTLFIPGWNSLTLDGGRLLLEPQTYEIFETATVEAELPCALFSVHYSRPLK